MIARVKQLTKAQVVELLRKKQGNRTARELAAELEVSEGYLSEIFSGTRRPGPMILEKLGLKEEAIYKQVSQ